MAAGKALNPAGLILTPGAGSNRDHPTLIALEVGLKPLPVLRLTLATTRIPTAIEKIRCAGKQLADELGVDSANIAYGGRSFGGRACSVAVAEGMPACALVLLSYPLHPPGKPDKLRVDHFPNISVPTLFISGEKDPFGSRQEFDQYTCKIPAPITWHSVKGNHSPKGQDAQVIDLTRQFLGLA